MRYNSVSGREAECDEDILSGCIIERQPLEPVFGWLTVLPFCCVNRTATAHPR